MKETPPVLTAGTAAWIRDQGRKRSRLLGTRPSLAAGGRGGLRARSRPSPRAGSAFALGPREARKKRVVSPPGACGLGSPLQPRGLQRGWAAEARSQRTAAGWGKVARDPGAWRPSRPRRRVRQSSRGSATQVCTPSPRWPLSDPLKLTKWE